MSVASALGYHERLEEGGSSRADALDLSVWRSGPEMADVERWQVRVRCCWLETLVCKPAALKRSPQGFGFLAGVPPPSLLPPLPRRHRVLVGPEPAPGRPSLGLKPLQ